MATQALSKSARNVPSVFDDFFRPWNEWFDNGGFSGRVIQVPAVNITEENNAYVVSLAAPGLKKEDFKITLDSNMLTISSEKSDTKEETEKSFTRKEFNYSSFSRSFTLPEEVDKEQIHATYEDGVLKITIARSENGKRISTKQITVQ